MLIRNQKKEEENTLEPNKLAAVCESEQWVEYYVTLHHFQIICALLKQEVHDRWNICGKKQRKSVKGRCKERNRTMECSSGSGGGEYSCVYM